MSMTMDGTVDGSPTRLLISESRTYPRKLFKLVNVNRRNCWTGG